MTSAPRLACVGVEKSFGGTRALRGADLSIAPGEVHALIGENGAGKSTLTQIVAGVLTPERGSLTLDGAAYAPRSPEAARRAGVAIVYQEPTLCPHLSVAENVLLGAEPASFGVVDRKSARQLTQRALARVSPGRDIAPDSLAGELGPAESQLVCIARALAVSDCKLLILDEPTASLPAAEVEHLFEVVRRLKEQGIAVLYISHFLEEVRAITDRYTVLRDGKAVGSGDTADTTADALVEMMSGRRLTERARRATRSAGEVRLSLAGLGGRALPRDASLELRSGEVLGIAGLVGAGRTELLRAIFGLDPVRRGTLKVGVHTGPASPARRWAAGMGMVSEDRKREGLAGALTLWENLTLTRMPFVVRPQRQRELGRTWIDKLGIRAAGPEQRAAALSGGNQQKLAIARLLWHDVDVLLLDEPTRGIDVQSRLEVYRVIDELAGRGKAVLLVSSQFPELLALSDRIAVMHRGALSAPRPAAELDEHSLAREAAGA